MSDLIARDVSSLGGDHQLLELMHASTDANVKTVIHVLVNGIPIDRLQPNTAAVEYALRLAQRDIPANVLVRAYSVGKDDFIEQMFPDVQALECTTEEKFTVLHHMSTTAGHYVDYVSQLVFEIYERERERWISTRGNMHASLIHEVLSNRGVKPQIFERETGYRLDSTHVGLVIWSSENDVAPDELRPLEHVVRRLAAAAGTSGAPLITAVDRSTAWAWLPFASPSHKIDLDSIRAVAAEMPTCRISLGLMSPGTAGFRRTHEQAQAARRVAVAPGQSTQIVSFGDEGIAITSILAGDVDSTRAWVNEVLGALAFDDSNMEVLRETLRVFLISGENVSETATSMQLHRNSVRYRVKKAMIECGSENMANRIDIAVALNACHFLGPTILRPAPRAKP
ncbi:PucR family transcriptional regulator [Rhodococcus jostii]